MPDQMPDQNQATNTPIDLSAGLTPKQPVAQTPDASPIDLSAGLIPKQGPSAAGPTIGPAPKSSDFDASLFTPSDPVEALKYKMTMPLAKALMAAHDKLREVQNFTQEGRAAHPVQAKLGEVADSIEGFLFGGAQQAQHNIGTGQYGIVNNPVITAVSAAAPAAEAAEGLEGAVSAYRANRAAKTASAAEEAPGIVKQIVRGEKVAQPQAQEALRTGVKAGGAEGGVSTVQNQSLRTIVEEPTHTLEAQAKANYRQIDKAAGTDFKALQEKLDNTEYQIRQLTETEEDIAKEAHLEKARTATIEKIEAAKQQAIDNGVDPKLLDTADAQFKQARALKDLEMKVFKNPEIVQGNAALGTPETVNVDKAIKALQKLQDAEKYGGSRLEQALGKEGANNLLKNLYEAQRVGQKALKVQQVAKWLGGLAGAGAVEEVILHAR